MKVLYTLLLIFNFIKIILTDDDKQMKNISMLACAALTKKMLEIPKEVKIFNDVSQKFSEKIKYDIDQTKNFVNLVLLNNCFNKITFEEAGTIIRERAETKTVNPSHLSLLNLENSFDEYNSLEQEEKKELFKELAEVKDILRGISDSMGEIEDKLASKNTDKGDSQNKPKSQSKGKNNKEELNRKKTSNENNDSNEEPSLLYNFAKTYLFIVLSFVNLLYENIFIVGFCFILIALFSLLGKRRLRKKIKTNISQDDKNQ